MMSLMMSIWLMSNEAEGRKETCGDYAWTDLVYKRSTDDGETWSSIKVLRSNSSSSELNVIGNAAPVQCDATKRILVPHNRNNREVWMIHSDDDGITWSVPSGPFPHLTKKIWSWIGLGPPSGLQLRSMNRIIIPSYHSIPHLDGDIAKGHIMYSDDNGETWELSEGVYGLGAGGNVLEYFPSESQAVELTNGSILINSRGESQHRIGSISHDFGATFEPSFWFNDLVNQMTGCEGSTIRHPNSGNLYYSGVSPSVLDVLRYNMTIYRSTDEGLSWEMIKIIDRWSSAYSAMVPMEQEYISEFDAIGILYETANIVRAVFIPDAISFEILQFAKNGY